MYSAEIGTDRLGNARAIRYGSHEQRQGFRSIMAIAILHAKYNTKTYTSMMMCKMFINNRKS